MSISAKRLTKFILTIPFVIMLTISIVLMVTPPYDASSVMGIILVIILSLVLIIGRKSLFEFFRRDEFRTSVKN